MNLRLHSVFCATLVLSLLSAVAADKGKQQSDSPKVKPDDQQGNLATNGSGNLSTVLARTNSVGQVGNNNVNGRGGSGQGTGDSTNSHPANASAPNLGQGVKSNSTATTVQAFSAALSTSVPILAHWKFDEASGMTATDSSGNNLHGTLSASGAAFVAGGKSGNALQLSKAANGYVNMGNILPLTSGSFSIAVWIKRNSGDTTDASFVLTRHMPGFANGYFLNVNTAGGPAYGQVNKVMFYDTSGDVSGSAYSTSSMNDGQWHHVVAVYEVGIQKRIYVDGTPVQGTGVAGGIGANTAPLLVGGLAPGGVPTGYFTGWLDELMVFGKALSNLEIDDLYASYFRAPGTPGGLVAAAGNQQVTMTWSAASPGATSYKVKRATTLGGPYTLAGTPAGTSFVDASLNNGTVYYYVVSAVNSVGEGPNSVEVNATPVPPPLPNAPGNLGATAGNQSVWLAWSASSPAVTSYKVKRAFSAAGPFTVVGTPVGTSFTDNALNNGTTYYYVVSAVNGTGEGPNTAPVSATATATALLAHWRFDESGGGTAIDSSGNGRHGTLSASGAAFVAGGKSGNALQLSKAANGFVNMGNVLMLNSGSFSIAVWLKRNAGDTTDASFILTKHSPGYGNGYFLNVNTAGGPAYGQVNKVMFYDTSGDVSGSAYSTTSMNDGQWHHVVAVYEVGIQKRIYVDGTPVQGTGGAGGIGANTAPLLVGGLAPGGVPTGYFTGWLDELMVFGKALSNPEIDALYASYTGGLPGAPGNLVATPGNQQVTLTWATASPGVTSYRVKRATSTSGPYTLIASPVGTSFVDSALNNGTTYYYVVSAVNSTGEGPDSAPVSATPAVPPLANAPGNLAAAPGNQQVTLGWAAAAPGVTGYNVKYATSPGGPYTILVPPVTSLSAIVSPLANGTTYYFKVSANNAAGQGPDSAVVSATPAAPPPPALPGAPTGLAAVAGDQQVTLNWSAATPNVTGYNVKYATSPGGPFTTRVPPVTSLGAIVNTLVNGTTYYFKVSAINSAGEGPDSAVVSATPAAAPSTPPSIPANLVAVAGDTQVTLSWNPSSPGVLAYNVKFATSAAGPFSPAGAPSGTTFTHSGLVNGTTYYFKVSAVNSFAESADSVVVSATPTATPPPVLPSAPASLAATPGDQRVSLSWAAATPNVTSYNVKRADTPGGGYTVIGTVSVPGLSFVDSGLVNGTTYYYVVSAVNAAGEGLDSTEVSATPALPPPTLPTAPGNVILVVGSHQQTLRWDAATPEVTSYKVQRATSLSGPWELLTASTPNTWFMDTTAAVGQTYYYLVSALNALGEGPASGASRAVLEGIYIVNLQAGQIVSGVVVLEIQVALSGDIPTKDAVGLAGVDGDNTPQGASLAEYDPTTGLWRLEWDTTVNANGNYRLQPTGYYFDEEPANGSSITVSSANTITFPGWVSDFSSELPISAETSIPDAAFSVELYDSQNQLVRTLAGVALGNSISSHWDGLDGNGAVVDSDVVTVKIVLSSAAAAAAAPAPASGTKKGVRRYLGSPALWVVAYQATNPLAFPGVGGDDGYRENTMRQIFLSTDAQGNLGTVPLKMDVKSAADVVRFRNQILDPTSGNLYFSGHSGPAHAAYDPKKSHLEFIDSKQTGILLGNLDVDGKPKAGGKVFRFVWLDGCNTAGKGTRWPDAFGIPALDTTAKFSGRGQLPRAYVGWDGVILDDRELTVFATRFFGSQWGGTITLEDALRSAADAPTSIRTDPFSRFSKLTIVGAKDLLR